MCDWQLARLYVRSGRESDALPILSLSGESRDGWERGGWEGFNRALANATGGFWGVACPSLFLVEAGAREEMYSCFEAELDATVDVPMSGGFGPVNRRLALIWNIRFADSFRPFRDQPRFKELRDRLDDRVQAAAGTYEQKIGIQLAR